MRELSLNVMDVAQNSISAEAALVTIAVDQDTAAGTLLITIEDDGRGMTPQQVENVQSPFYTTRTTRSVGLGVPLFKMASEMTGGSFSIQSALGVGTVVKAGFHTGHIDMVPLGEMGETVLLLVSCNPDMDFVYRRTQDGRTFAMDTRELREVLGGDVALNNPEVVTWMQEYLAEQEQALQQPPPGEQ